MRKLLLLLACLSFALTVSATDAVTDDTVDPDAPATPTFDPPSGTVEPKSITISCATEGAEIYYSYLPYYESTDKWELYTQPLSPAPTSFSLGAYAVKDGRQSEVAIARYTVYEISGIIKIWEQKFFTIPASSDARFATGFGGAIYAAQKATADAPGKILKYTQEGVTEFATVEGMGSAISSDEAGNILVNKGFPTVNSATNWLIIEPDGTQHELTIELPSGIEPCRVDQVGRVAGNLMSAKGAWFYIAGNGQPAVAAIKVVNGAQDVSASAASPTVSVAMNTSTLAQPMFRSVKKTEDWVDPSTAFYSRNRGANKLYSWLDDGSEQYSIDNSFGSGGNEGFDVAASVNLLIGVVSVARTNEFIIKDVSNDAVFFDFSDFGENVESVPHQFRAYTLRWETPNHLGIYVWNAGYSAEYYGLYGFPCDADDYDDDEGGVNSAASNAAEVLTTYYNLQGVRVLKPSSGQICIRVATLSDGSVRASKVVAR